MPAGYTSAGGASADGSFRSAGETAKGLTTHHPNRRGDYSAISITNFDV